MESEASELIVKNVKRDKIKVDIKNVKRDKIKVDIKNVKIDKIIRRDIHLLRVVTITSRMSQSLLRG
jgi:hypothetical protein